MIKKFFRGVLLSLMGIIVLTLLFSSGGFSVEKIQVDIFDDIYEHASESSKGKFFSKMSESCSSIVSGEAKTDIENLEMGCDDYNAKKIGDKEFFLELIASSMKQKDLTEIQELNTFRKINDLLNNSLLFIIAIIVLLIPIFFLSRGFNDFISSVGKSLFNIGIVIILSFLALKAYINFSAPDTSFIFESISGNSQEVMIGPMLKVLLPLLLLDAYNILVVVVGVVFIVLGIIIKVLVKKQGKKVKH